jgi:hypothetical protein
MFRQCKFQKDNTFQTAWVENKPGLRVGAIVEIKSDNHELWKVVELGSGLQPQERVQELASDHMSQRKASDI